MARGRKLTTGWSERYLGTYSYNNSHGPTASDASEFGEVDIWSSVDDVFDGDGHTMNAFRQSEWEPRAAEESNGCASVRNQRRIPREDDSNVGGLSLAFEDSGKAARSTTSSRVVHQYRGRDNVAPTRGHQVATSAPVNVPDWSKILRVDSVDSLPDMNDSFDEDISEMVPPHEYLAREYARSRKMAANSVFEGVGRTLKGRDLRRVRDAVWSQTGFYG